MVNSDTSYAQTVACGSTLTLPDVTHTDSNGTPVTLPGMVAFVATPCGPCAPTTVNGTQSDTPTITVLQGGEQVGTLNPATGVHTVPECDPCPVPECDDLVDAVVVEGADDSESNGLYRFDGYGGPAGIMAAKKYRNANDHIIAASDFDAPDGPFGWALYDSLLTEYYTGGSLPFNVFPSQGQWASIDGEAPAPTVRQATIADLCPCAPTTVNGAESATPVITVVQGGSPTGNLDPITGVVTVPRTDPLKWVFTAGDGGSAVVLISADEADDYDVFTDDGSSGTVEIRINGGSWAVPSGVVTLGIGDTLEARRSVWSAQGWLTMERV